MLFSPSPSSRIKSNKFLEDQDEKYQINEKNENNNTGLGKSQFMTIFFQDSITDEKQDHSSQFSLISSQIQPNCKKKIEFNAFGSNNCSQEIDLFNFFN